MTRVDFHVNVAHRVQYACRVARKARAAGKRLLVYSPDPERLSQVDTSLWTFSALDFLPHVYVDSPLAPSTPILLTLHIAVPVRSDVLVTLADDLPQDLAQQIGRFERVIEIVSTDENDRLRGRHRFKAYRELGYQPQTHAVATE